jgi:hypothetical protein
VNFLSLLPVLFPRQVHPSRQYFAVGEKGTNPNIYIYEYPALTVYRVLRKGTECGFADLQFEYAMRLCVRVCNPLRSRCAAKIMRVDVCSTQNARHCRNPHQHQPHTGQSCLGESFCIRVHACLCIDCVCLRGLSTVRLVNNWPRWVWHRIIC